MNKYIFAHLVLATSCSKVVDIRLMFNVNQPSEWDEDVLTDYWDENGFTDAIDRVKGDDLNLKITLESDKYFWIPEEVATKDQLYDQDFFSYI